MKSALEYRIAEFVDRVEEMKRFCEFLEKRTKPIIYVSGSGGIGKSSLLARMLHECSLRQIMKASVGWTDTHNYDYLALMRRLRDDLGAEHFTSFTSLVNAYYDENVKVDLSVSASGNISVAAGAQITNATVGAIAGVVIRDCMFIIPRRDLGVSENERMFRLTEAFLSDLRMLAESKPIVLFFDAVEKMATETNAWMWGALMTPVRDGLIEKLLCVHFGQVRPNLDREMSRAVEYTELGPLGLADIEEYLAKREVKCAAPHELATFILAVTAGLPIEVANKVDLFEGELQKQARKVGF